jgi:hypothetical protein
MVHTDESTPSASILSLHAPMGRPNLSILKYFAYIGSSLRCMAGGESHCDGGGRLGGGRGCCVGGD